MGKLLKLAVAILVLLAGAFGYYLNSPKSRGAAPSGIRGVYLVPNRAYYPVAESLIENATSSILGIYMYIQDKEESRRVVDSLIGARSRGVSVYLILEGDFSEESSSAFTRLRGAGVQVKYDGYGFIHAKLMVVDHRFVLIGSHNLSPYALELNNELSLLIDNESVASVFEGVFSDLWDNGVLNEDHTTSLTGMAIIQGMDLPAYLLGAVEGARSNISMMYYTFKYYGDGSDCDRMADALVNASAEGVSVKVYLDNRRTNKEMFSFLSSKGVRVKLSEGPLTHTKLTVVDGRILFIGDTNLAKSYFHSKTVSFTIMLNATDLAELSLFYFDQIWVNGKLVSFPTYAVIREDALLLVNAGEVKVRVEVSVYIGGNVTREDVDLPPGRAINIPVQGTPSRVGFRYLSFTKGE